MEPMGGYLPAKEKSLEEEISIRGRGFCIAGFGKSCLSGLYPIWRPRLFRQFLKI